MAFAGEQQGWWEVLEWLNAGAPKNAKPHVSRIEMIIAGPDGVYEMFDRLVRMPVTGPVAYGTGWKWALAAIDHGRNAVEAVKYAATRDHDTGGDVQSVTLPARVGMSFDALMREADTTSVR